MIQQGGQALPGVLIQSTAKQSMNNSANWKGAMRVIL